MTAVEYDGFGPLFEPIRIAVLGTPVPEGSTKAIRYRIAKEYKESGGTYTEQYGVI